VERTRIIIFWEEGFIWDLMRFSEQNVVDFLY